jgi:hypothetical protein
MWKNDLNLERVKVADTSDDAIKPTEVVSSLTLK